MTARFANPAPVELVGTVDVETLVAAAHEEFAELERRATEAIAVAEREEERARSLRIDLTDGPRAMVKVQQFIAEWRAEVDQEAERIVAVAREGSRVRVDDARADAERIRRAHPRALTSPAALFLGREDVPDLVGAPAAEPPPAPSTPTATASAEQLVVREQVPGIADPPASDGDVVAPAEVHAEPVPAAPPVPAVVEQIPSPTDLGVEPAGHGPDLVQEPPAAPAATPTGEQGADVPAAADGSTEGGFWAAAPETKKSRGLLRRIPLSAVLEVIAVVLILVFILLRLS